MVIATSGGADSSALACLLAESIPDRALHLAWIDHGFRPADRAADVRAVHGLAEMLSLPLREITVPPPPGWAPGNPVPEQLARSSRYRALITMAEGCDADVIATGHHAGDQLETQLLQLLRGGDLRALQGIKAVRRIEHTWLWRPLLRWTREELGEILSERGFRASFDPSNCDLRMRRNALRRRVIPALRAQDDPLVARAERLAELAAAGLARIHRAAAGFAARHRQPSALERTWLLPQSALARRHGMTRARLRQIRKLLALPMDIVDYSDRLNDPELLATLSDHRLRVVSQVNEGKEHQKLFRKMIRNLKTSISSISCQPTNG